MTIAGQFDRGLADLCRLTIVQRMVVTAFLGLAAPDVADARTGIGAYDGAWNVLIITQAGHCDPAYRYPFQVAGGRISSSGAATVSGSVGRWGGTTVRISAAGALATGRRRLRGRSGACRRSARLSGGNCSGRWEATRGM